MPVDLALSVGMLRAGLISRIGLAIEAFGYRLASHLVVLGSGFGKKLVSRGIPASKISHLPIWLDLDQVRPVRRTQETRDLLGVSPQNQVVLHYGNMGEKQALRSVIDAAALLFLRSPNVVVVFVGAGPQRDNLQLRAESLGLQNVRFIGLQPSEQTAEILAVADIVLLNQHPGVVDSVVPQKLVAYMSAGRPVIAAANSDSGAAEVIRDSSCGIVVPPDDATALADGIGQLLSSPDRLADLGVNGRAYAAVHYDSRVVLKHWELLLTEVGMSAGNRKRVGKANH
jgi:colanic acid biosynthesis glycosyl transferase WcaI